jgi:RHS repeat-associated protein
MEVVQELEGTTKAAPVKAHLLTGGIDEMFLRLEGNDGANQHSVLSAAHSTIMLLNAAQSKIVGYSYEPYGATTADVADNNTTQYAGRENDDPGDDRGLYYYRARYYMPGIARFISEDPIGWASRQSNNYAYVGGDPINFIDPLGLDANQNTEDLFAGFGDMLTFGLGPVLREWVGVEGVNPNSGWYLGGEVLGLAATLALPGIGVAAEEAAVGEGAIPRGGPCFAAGTKISTPTGDVEIEDIKTGDTVYAYDFGNGQAVEETVEAIHQNRTYHWVEIEVNGETIRATKSHPFWVEKENRWYRAVDLKPGMELHLRSGEAVAVRSIKVDDLDQSETTYNFEVAHQHNYYVGSSGVLVHNGPSFAVSPNGTVFPIPNGATPGPLPSGKPGIWYGNGAGGNGLNSRVTDFSIRDGNAAQGTSTRASYYNASGQKVDPFTGRTISNSDPMAHIPCD